MPDSFQEEVDDLLPLFPLPEHNIYELMKDSKYSGNLVAEVCIDLPGRILYVHYQSSLVVYMYMH